MRLPAAILIYTFVFSGIGASAQADNAADIFDKPWRVERTALPKDSFSGSQSNPALSCFHYANVTVKQIDRGAMGAEQISLIPPDADQPTAQCTEANASGEKVLNGQKWSGYFMGVRADYAFVEAADGVNGGVSFAVFAVPGGQKIFEDLANGLHGIDPMANGLMLRYRRVYPASCSLYADLAGCWDKVKQETGLTGEAPDCTAAYFAEIKRVEACAQETAASPSVIDYEVVTLIEGARSATKPLPGQLACRLSD